MQAAQEIKTGKPFCLILLLNVPATDATNGRRNPQILNPSVRDGRMVFNLRINTFDPNNNQVITDDSVLLYKQHSSQWHSFGHVERLSKDKLAAGCENAPSSNLFL